MEMACPVPVTQHDRIILAHGGGGKLTHNLIQQVFYKHFANKLLLEGHDGAMFSVSASRMAFTTDSYVVQPLFFPGGNIGDLAVNGTVNDLVCCGATPLYLSTGFIIEEGFLLSDLDKICESMRKAADLAGVSIVTGDTKVVEKGKGDGVFINTSGIGIIAEGVDIHPNRCKPGDVVIINGFIADHGIAIMNARAGFEFESDIKSDSAALNKLISKVFAVTKDIHVLRDPTRGGVASTLNEIAKTAEVCIGLDEDAIPVSEPVKACCEILGFDPLYVANEGKIILILPEIVANLVLETMKADPLGKDSAIIGRVSDEYKGIVRMKTIYGSHRIIDMISGEQLPRIC